MKQIKDNNMLRLLSFLLVWNILFYSCKNDRKNINISNVSIDILNERFDKLFTQNEPISYNQWHDFETRRPQFSEVFSQQILGVSSHENSYDRALAFQHYFDSIGFTTTIKTEFESFPEFERFTLMQRRLKASFDDFSPVSGITMISGFNYKNMLLDKTIGIGLDMYLGDKIEYDQMGDATFSYQLHRFDRSYIVPDLCTALVDDYYPDNGELNTFLKRIIYEGKKLYVKQQVLPAEEPYRIIGFQSEDYEWCVKNERKIWQYFVAEELLYSNDIHRFKTYVFDGPFSAGMPEDAPAQTGNFIGWQIVKSYMENHNETTLEQLLKDRTAQEILNGAKYSP